MGEQSCDEVHVAEVQTQHCWLCKRHLRSPVHTFLQTLIRTNQNCLEKLVDGTVSCPGLSYWYFHRCGGCWPLCTTWTSRIHRCTVQYSARTGFPWSTEFKLIFVGTAGIVSTFTSRPGGSQVVVSLRALTAAPGLRLTVTDRWYDVLNPTQRRGDSAVNCGFGNFMVRILIRLVIVCRKIY